MRYFEGDYVAKHGSKYLSGRVVDHALDYLPGDAEYILGAEPRSVHNDVIGWQIAILGTIYAVMIGFMLYAVWNNFQTAETNANNEANDLVNLYRAADGLPQAAS